MVGEPRSNLIERLIDESMVATDVHKRVLQRRVEFHLTQLPSEFENKMDEPHLCEFWPHAAHNVDVHQVRLCPERTETRSLNSCPTCPPTGEVLKVLVAVACVDLELELTDGKHVILGVCGEERRECVKLPTLDVNLEDVDYALRRGSDQR